MPNTPLLGLTRAAILSALLAVATAHGGEREDEYLIEWPDDLEFQTEPMAPPEYHEPTRAHEPALAAWSIAAGESLKHVLHDWATVHGWQVAWNVRGGRDFRMETKTTIPANSFIEAVRILFNSLPPEIGEQRFRLFAEIWPENNPPLVVVTGTHR